MLQTGFHKQSATLRIDALKPLLFDACDFTRKFTDREGHDHLGCRIFSVTGAPPTTPHSVMEAAHFEQEQNTLYFKDQINDIVDGGYYLPVYGDYTLKLTGQNLTRPIRVTLHMFTIKAKNYLRFPTQAGSHDYLPHSLPYLLNMASPEKNAFSKEHFNLWSSKTVMLMPPALSLQSTQKYCYFKVRPKKVRTQVVTDPVSLDSVTPESTDGGFGFLNVPLGQPYWCLLSTDADHHGAGDVIASAPNLVNVTMSRHVGWRDKTGAA